MRFPGGRVKALTLSYDDGVDTDIRLMELMRQNGLKGTFNINSGMYAEEGTIYPQEAFHRRMTRRQVLKQYKTDVAEVAVHTSTHPHLEELPSSLCIEEILEDRKSLEKDFDCLIRGMAYPYGTYNDQVVQAVQQCGIVYARTVQSTHGFELPTNWLTLHPTCHHNDPKLMELLKDFLSDDRKMKPMLFYLWGHSYEFERDNNWEKMEEFARCAGGHPDIWYATNLEIYNYVMAYRQLVFSADGTRAANPTSSELFFQKDDTIFKVGPGETI